MAAEGGFVWDESYTAAASLASNQYYIIKSTGADTANLCTGSSGGSAGPRGVVQNDPASGQAATVRHLGKTKISAGGTVSIGDLITCTTGGQALAATTTGQLCIGRANSASTAAGQVIEAFLFTPIFYTAGATA
jgi:hypothetical protein